uniref:Uncharacterized protein n=1 Tax=virus sp. ctd0M1 TaxID=2827993 RepID=A0A8S5RES2_9VIRU|nr:MAG TPA: hypothetical protein [virus sp. ctd0M1]
MLKKQVNLINAQTGQRLCGEFYAERDTEDNLVITQRVSRDVFIQLPPQAYAGFQIQLKKDNENE